MGSPAKNPVAARFGAYDPLVALELTRDLGLKPPVAAVLARRGIENSEQARRFLAADLVHPPASFAGMKDATATIRAAIETGERITVHGDYDADGVCATALLVSALSRLGADCDWLIPSRLADGYGLQNSLPEKLAERGTSLLITVDCGIGSVDVVAGLAEAGIRTVVTDHHRPGETLPACPVIHPELGYPFAGLCGTAVAGKLAEALLGEPFGLDLVAIATVADSVPLVDENRRLVREGLAALARRPRPGLRALMASCRVNPEMVAATDVAFRLAPRINAAGRLYRADAGVELLLCDDEGRAAEIATELERANGERRAIEAEVVAEAKRQAAEIDPDGSLAGLVLAARGWHPGVIGIAASRIAEQREVPVVLIALDELGNGTGSCRSVPGADLLVALKRCGGLLERFGGHAAAAGLQISEERVDDLRREFALACAELPVDSDATANRLDGVLTVGELDLELAQAIEQLGPFGQANPEPLFLVADAHAEMVSPMGEEGRHARLTLRSGRNAAAAVVFGAGPEALAWAGNEIETIVRPQVNNWNGAVSARAVIDSARPVQSVERHCCGAAAQTAREYLGRVAATIERLDRPPVTEPAEADLPVHRVGRPPLAALADIASSGARVLVITADARRRSSLAAILSRVEPDRAAPALVCSRCARPELETGAEHAITDWQALGAGESALPFDLVAILDPPPSDELRSLAVGRCRSATAVYHLAGAAEIEFAASCLRAEWDIRAHAAAIYRALRALDEATAGPAEMAAALGGERPIARTPASASRALVVLAEVGLIAVSRSGLADAELSVRVLSSERTDLERSVAYRRYCGELRAGESFLSRQQQLSQAA